MDDYTRKRIREQIRYGTDPWTSARQAGVPEYAAQAEGLRVKAEMDKERSDSIMANNQLLMDIVSPQRPKEESSGGGGIIFFLMAAFFIGGLLPFLLFLFFTICMIFNLALSLRGDHPVGLLSWTILGSMVMGLMVFAGNGEFQADPLPSLWFVDFHGLATGSPVTGALALGLCLSALPPLLPVFRASLLRKLDEMAVVPALRLFLALGKSTLLLRIVLALIFVPVVAFSIYAIFGISGMTWQLRICVFYALALTSIACIRALRITASQREFIETLAAMDIDATLFELNRKSLMAFVRSRDLDERYEIERQIIPHPAAGRHMHIIERSNGSEKFTIRYPRGVPRTVFDLPLEERQLLLSLYGLQNSRSSAAERLYLAEAILHSGFDMPEAS